MTTHPQPAARLRAFAAAAALVALLPATAVAQELAGVVRDAGSREPVPSATVSLLGADGAALARVLSDSAGRFTLTAPRPGAYRLEVRRIGYAARAPETLRLEPGAVTEVEVLLSTEPVALEAVVVETRSRRAREAVARGTPLRLLTRQDIEEVERRSNPQHVGDLARAFSPDVVVKYATRAMDGYKTICIEAVQRVRRTVNCDMVLVVLDGMIIEDPSLVLHGMVPDHVESMEFLKPTEGGVRYGTLGGQGVLLINTRGSGEWAPRRGTVSQAPGDAYDLALTGGVSGLGAAVLGGLLSCGLLECPFLGGTRLSSGSVGLELAFTTPAIPLGVHLANHRRGSLLAGLLASAAIGAAGYAAWDATGSDLVFLATPVAQVLGAVVAERLTTRDAEMTPVR